MALGGRWVVCLPYPPRLVLCFYLVNLQPILWAQVVPRDTNTSVVSPCWLLNPTEPWDQFSPWPQARIHTAGELLTQGSAQGSCPMGTEIPRAADLQGVFLNVHVFCAAKFLRRVQALDWTLGQPVRWLLCSQTHIVRLELCPRLKNSMPVGLLL